MLGRTHAVTGVASALALGAAAGTLGATPLAAYAVAGATALLPDLDQHAALALRIPGTRLVHPFLRRLRHRGPTHSLLGLGVFGAALAAILGAWGNVLGAVHPTVWAAGMAGYASHLFADMWNKRGVALLWGFVRPGSRFEWISVPLPKRLRISTVHDRESIPFTPGRLQARIPTERVFFRWPVYLAIGYILWHHGAVLADAARSDVLGGLQALPAPLERILLDALR